MTLSSIAQSLILGAEPHHGGEASLVLPDLSDPSLTFLGVTGHNLLLAGIVVSALGLLFGLVIARQVSVESGKIVSMSIT